MVRKPAKDITDVIREIGKYPPDACHFVQEGLSFTVQKTQARCPSPSRR